MKVFLDTHAWLSATIFAGLCEALVTECADRDWLISSRLVRDEAHEVLVRKFPLQLNAPALFDSSWLEIPQVADVTEPANDNDARLVAAAVAAKADLFVTGDKRVLGWKQSGTLRIVTPRVAWGILFAPHLQH